MTLLSLLFPPAFAALALAHFVALLSPGPDFFLLTGYAIRQRLRGSYGICLGIALGNAVYIALAIVGWAGLRHLPLLFTLLETLGMLYLLWIGSHLLRSARRPLTLDGAGPCLSLGRQLLLGLGSSLLNPKNALFYFSLMTAILGDRVTLLQQVICGIWMFMLVLLWDLLIVTLIGRGNIQRLLRRSLHWIERAAGITLIGFALALFIHRYLLD